MAKIKAKQGDVVVATKKSHGSMHWDAFLKDCPRGIAVVTRIEHRDDGDVVILNALKGDENNWTFRIDDLQKIVRENGRPITK